MTEISHDTPSSCLFPLLYQCTRLCRSSPKVPKKIAAPTCAPCAPILSVCHFGLEIRISTHVYTCMDVEATLLRACVCIKSKGEVECQISHLLGVAASPLNPQKKAVRETGPEAGRIDWGLGPAFWESTNTDRHRTLG